MLLWRNSFYALSLWCFLLYFHTFFLLHPLSFLPISPTVFLYSLSFCLTLLSLFSFSCYIVLFLFSHNHSLFLSFSLWLTEGVQRHQSVCGWGAVCTGERAEAYRRPSSSCGEEAALSHGHRYPKPNYTGKTVLANWAYVHMHIHTRALREIFFLKRERIFEAPHPCSWMLHDGELGGYERRGCGVREEEEKGGNGWVERERERGELCISGMWEEGRPLWAGVIREPFMGEMITARDSGAPAEVSTTAVCQPQPANLHSIEHCAQPCTATHTHLHTLLPLVHIWPSLICCIRKDWLS